MKYRGGTMDENYKLHGTITWGYQLLIMEKLAPLDGRTARLLLDLGTEQTAKNEDSLHSIAKLIARRIWARKDHVVHNQARQIVRNKVQNYDFYREQHLVEKEYKILLQKFPPEEILANEISKILFEFNYDKSSELSDNYKGISERIIQKLFSSSASYVEVMIINLVHDVLSGLDRWPADPHEVVSGNNELFEKTWGGKPELTSLVKTMTYLTGKNIHWGDLHLGNIMIRPSTGDLVMVDLGLFSGNN